MKTIQLFLAFALLFMLNSNAQNVITVDNSPSSNAQYNDLQTAIEAAVSEDIIYIHPSETNYGNITIPKTLHLRGFAHSDPDKATLITDIKLLENASNSSFSGLRLTNDFIVHNSTTTLTGLVFENNIVSQMIFRDAGVDGMIIRGNIIWYIGTSATSSTYNNYTNTTISNNIITGRINLENYQSITVKNNIFLTGNPFTNYASGDGSITVQNNIFYYSTTFTVNINALGVIFENCLAYNLGSGNVAALSGSNNIINTNPQFVNAANAVFNPDIDDYHLQVGSPAIGTGIDGADMGIYNTGPFVFNNFGYTNGLPTVKITSITKEVAPDTNIEVTIETNSN